MAAATTQIVTCTDSGANEPADPVVLVSSILYPKVQWAWLDSNQRPHAYQACALTS